MTVPTEPMGAPNLDVLADDQSHEGKGMSGVAADIAVEVDAAAPGGTSVMVERRGAALVLTVSGDLDYVGTPRIRERVLELLATRPTLPVIDLLGAGFVGSAGLALLAEATHLRWPDTMLRVVAAGPTLRPIQLTGLESLLRVSHSVADALTTTSAGRCPSGWDIRPDLINPTSPPTRPAPDHTWQVPMWCWISP